MGGETSSTLQRHEEFVRLFLSQERAIKGFILTLVPMLHVAEDLAQQTCIVMLRKFDDFKPTGDPAVEFRRWACAVAHNEVRNYRRKAGRDQLVFSGELVEALAESHEEQLEEGVAEDSAARMAVLERCLAKLNEFDRQLLAMRYHRGLRGAQIAESVGRSIESIYKRIARSKERLRECVALHRAD
jgi:RNA polymerase sigma-70 factor (ECF subfamily)